MAPRGRDASLASLMEILLGGGRLVEPPPRSPPGFPTIARPVLDSGPCGACRGHDRERPWRAAGPRGRGGRRDVGPRARRRGGGGGGARPPPGPPAPRPAPPPR